MRTALIDGDEIAYKISSTYQNSYYGVYKDDRLLHTSRTRDDAIESIGNRDDLSIETIIDLKKPHGFEKKFTDTIDSICFNANCDDYVICLSGSKNFRYELATILPYKGNRSGSIKPGYYNEFRDYLLVNHPSNKVDHLEADDLLCYYGNRQKDKVICSTDKDLRTVPAFNYNISTQKYQKIDKATALYNFYIQLLIGDSTDNIPSPYNLGEKTAHKILSEIPEGCLDERLYITTILPHYIYFLTCLDKKGNLKTKWFDDQNVFDILEEVGNLIYMHRTLDPDERWELPEPYEELNEEEESTESQEEGELGVLEGITSERVMED